MKKVLFILLLIILGVCNSYAQWNSMGLDPNGRWDYEGHNTQGGVYDNPTLILLTVNGINVTELDMASKFSYYIVGYYEYRGAWTYATVGDIIVNDESITDGDNSIAGKQVSFTDTDYSGIHTKPDEWGMWETIGITFDWSDFKSGDAIAADDGTGAWEVIIVNRESGYCAASGRIYGYQGEIKINLADPTLITPTGPTLTVNPMIAGCWSNGKTFDLTLAKGNVSPADATVEYYSDGAGTAVIADPTKVVMTMANPVTPSEVKKYYARAISADGTEKSDIQEISVTFYQKPEVSLALSDKATTVCYNTPIVLQTTNENGFTPGKYTYVSEEASLNVDGGDSYSTTSMVSTTYKVYVTSGATVGSCKDTAEVDITVTPSIPAGDIQIAVNPDKSAICAGESLELTASVTGTYSGTITYQWGAGVAAADATKQTVTVKPSTNTTYTVNVQLDGCPASGGGGSKVITVNPLPTLTITNPAAVCGGTVDITQSGTGYHYYTDATLATTVADVTAVAAGDYYVTLTDAKGCTSEAKKVTATVNTPPTPKILVNGAVPAGDDLCEGTDITLTCDNTGYTTYTWAGGMATANSYERKATIVAGNSNTFTLTVKDANGCEGTATSVAITGKAAPTVTIDPVAAACKGDVVTLAATPTWVNGKQTILWQGNNLADAGNASTTATLNGGNNKYDLTLTDQNGCEVKASVTVAGNELKATGLTINPSSVKAGELVSLGITANWNGSGTNAGVSYVWKKTLPAPGSIIATSKTATDTPDANSTYEVVVEKGGCKDSVSGNVVVETDPFELAGISGYRAVCDGEDLSASPMKLYVTASGGQKNYTYTWIVPAGMSVESTNADTLKITGIDYSIMLAGNSSVVKVEVSDASVPANKASKTVAFEVRQLPQIKINGKDDGDVLNACKDITTELTAAVTGVTNGVTYSWNTGATSAKINASTGTVGTSSYTVTATYAGCSDQASVDVTVNELPEIKLTVTLAGADVTQVCPGAEITLTAAVTGVDAPAVVWGKGATGLTGTTPTTPVNALTTYEVKYTDASTTCEATTSVIVDVHPVVNLAIGVTPGTTVCAGSEVVLTVSNGATYQWAADGVDLMGETHDVLTVHPTTPVTYTARGKDVNGCEATPVSASITITAAPVLALSKTAMDGCIGFDVDLAGAVDKGNSTPGIALKVKDSKGVVLSGTTVNKDDVYTLYMDGGSCPSNEETVTVVFHAKPNVSFLADVSDVCSGGTVTLTANSTDDPKPAFTYAGTTNTAWTVNPTNTGSANTIITYTVMAKDSYGCTNTADALVTVKPLPDVKITDPGAVCASSEVTLTASGADTYAWTGGATPGDEVTYTVRPTTTNKQFFVTGTKDGCENTTDITLNVMEAPALAEAKDLAECVNNNVELKGAFTTGYTLSFFDENKAPLASSVVTVITDKTYYAKATVGTCSTDFKPIKVTAKPLPTVSIVGNDEICAGDETTLTATGTGVEYTWNPAGKGGVTKGMSIDANPATTTTYTLTAKGGNNCTADATLEVKVNPLPELKWDAGNAASLVAGETKTWNVGLKSETTSPYTYTWTHNGMVDNGYTNSNYALTGTVNPEELKVCVEDAKGCISKTIETSVPVTPQGGELTVALNAESKEICQGGMQILTATPGGGKVPYKYVWYKDGTDMGIADDVTTITVTDAAVYKVTVTDAGTTPQNKSADIEMKISASLTAPTVMVADLTIPTGNSAMLLPTVTPSAGNYTYQWSKVTDLKDAAQATLANPETRILTGDTPYDVIVKDANGCYAKATGTVHVDDVHGFKVLAAAAPDKVCIGNTAQLSATLSGNVPADVTYEWMPAEGLSATDIANPVFTSTTAGIREYIVKVTSNDGYVAAAKATVEVENKTAPTLVLTQAGDISCVGQAITVSAQGGNVSGYQWTIDDRAPISGGTTLDTLVAGNRKVKVTATAQNGCVVTPIEVDYLIHDLPTIDWDINTPAIVDKGTNLTVTAIADGGVTGNYTYTWNTTGGTANKGTYTALMNAAKTFKVSVTNEDTKCSSEEITTTVKIQTPTPNVEITVKAENVVLCQNGISLLEVTGVKGGNGTEDDFAAYTYAWTKAGSETILSAEKSYAATTAGTYTVKVTEPKTAKSATKDITVTNSSTLAPQVADATLTVQKNTQAYLSAEVTGGTPDYSYYWTPLGSLATSNTRVNPTTSALSAPETFTCYVTDANGCSGKGDIQVNVVESADPKLFTLLANADNTNPCKGNIVQLSATPSRTLNNPTYQWTPSTDLSADNIANPVFTANTPATVIYTVKVTEQGGYSVTAQVAITVKSAEAPRLELADNTGGCAGEKLTVTNQNASVIVANYYWVVNGVLDNSVTGHEYPLAVGLNQTVKVYADATNGCSSDTTSGIFSRKPTPAIAWNLKPVSATEGDDFTLSVTADAGVTYVWSYVFTPEGGVAEPKVDGADMDEFEMIGADKGTYEFTVYVEQDGCQSKALEHTVTVLEKGLGLAVTTDITNKQICENGSAIVTATGLNGSGTYTYTWYAGTAVSGTPVATGAVAMLSPTVNGQKYVVEVNDGVTTAVSLPVTLTFNANMAPVVAGGTQNVAAGHSTILLSQVTQGTATGYHWSSPNNLLATGEEAKPYPATKPLTADETYTYYVTDANGCISKPADVNVVVDNSADALAIKATAGMVNLCRGNVVHLNVVATQGTLSAAAVYEWTPSTYLTDANTGKPVFTATVAGNYTYRVKVTDQGKVLVAEVDVTVKAFDAPAFAWDSENPTSYALGGAFIMKTEVTKETTKPYSYHWLKPQDQTIPNLGQYSVQTATQPEYDFVVVMSDANGCQTSDTLKAHIEAGASGAQVEIAAENVKVCAVSADATGTAVLSVTKTAGPDKVTYLWKANGNSLPLSDANTANATVNIAGAAAGLYTFTITVTDADDISNKAEKNVLLNVSELPHVQIDETCLALHKDSIFVLNVANAGEYTYLWQGSMYDYALDEWQAATDKGSGKNCEVKMSEQDMRYVLIATDKSALQCKAGDTAVIYRIPDAPLIEIDTNKTCLDIKLEWRSVNANDGYTVWSRKWDPYCMTASDGGVYKEETSTIKNIWEEKTMEDTLVFYYITADKNVCGNTYRSFTSDTVGYYLFDVQMNSAGKASLNHLAIYFDMSRNGVKYRAKDLLTTLPLNLVKNWDFGNQVWQNARMMGGTTCIGDFDVVPGIVIQVEPKSACQYMQYGKLSLPLTTLLLNTNIDKGNLSHSYVWLHRLNLENAKAIFGAYSDKFKLIKMWDFSNQVWKNARMMGTTCVGDFDLQSLLPLQFELVKDNVQW